jgi:tetratricopeptide (TPR) repeat protein
LAEPIASRHLDEARTALLALLKAAPEDANALRQLAEVELQLKRVDRAILALEQLTAYRPTGAADWSRLAQLYGELAQWDKAVRAFEQAERLGLGGLQQGLGRAFALFGAFRFDELRRLLGSLRRRFPQVAAVGLLEGHLARMSGRTGEAKDAYRRAMTLDPGLSAAVFNLVELDPPAPESAQAQDLLRQAQEDPAGGPGSADLNFALGRIYEKAHRHGEAFHRYVRANAQMQQSLRARGVVYDPAVVEARVRQRIESYPASAFARVVPGSYLDLTPIFVVGMPRSGTTLVEQILASHPSVAAGGELLAAQDCHEAHAALRRRLGLEERIDWTHPGELGRLRELRQRYFDSLLTRALDAPFVTNKLPGDFEILGFIRMLLPDAIIVHCRRDPMATCWSLFTANFGAHSPYYNDLRHLAHYYGQYRRLMAHWAAVLRPGVIDIDYETLVDAPECSIRALIGACGLAWDDRCLLPHETERPVTTASAAQVRRPIYRSSRARWKPYAMHLGVLREGLENG